MRRATLDSPPLFQRIETAGPRLTLGSDTGAIAHVFVLEEDVMRLVVLPEGRFRHPRTWTVAPGMEDVADEGRDRMDAAGFSAPAFAVTETDGGLVVETSRMRLTIGLVGLRCTWAVRTGAGFEPLLEDRPTQAYDFGWWDGKVRHYLARVPGDQYFGLGEKSGPMDRTGRRLRLKNVDAMGYDAQTSDPLYKHMPFHIQRRPATGSCVGLFYDTLSDAVFDFGKERSNYHGLYRYFEAEHGDLDLYVIAGPALADVTRRFTWLTGRPCATPEWALDYSGSTMAYTDAPDAQAQMAAFLDRLSEHRLACGSFHLSSGYTSIGKGRYVFHWNRDKFPDPRAFVRAYAQAGVRLVANVKPALLDDHPDFADLAARGLFLSDADGPVREQFWDGTGAYLDFTNPEAAAWWKARVAHQLLDYGIAATWNDNNEFEVTCPASTARGFGAPFPAHEMKPLQTLLMMRASRQAQIVHAPGETPFLVSRAGCAGMQRYVQTWSGDNFTSWATLKWNIRMGLGSALCGVSNIGHDVGGFAGPRPDRELLLRWIGFGVFMPRFSIHSWNDDGSITEPWTYPDAMDTVRALFDLRARLKPDLAAALQTYRQDYTPAVRPVFFDFPDDPQAWEETDDFLLGKDILVCPVTTAGADARSVRLPRGAEWRCGWTGAVRRGGEAVSTPAPLDRPPWFRRL